MVVKLSLLGPAWTRTFRCIWMLEELGLEYTLVDEAVPWSRKIKKHQPSGKVPVLLEYQNDDKPPFVLTESMAINTYLGDQYGKGENNRLLVPSAGTKERALYDQTISCIVTELDAQSLWVARKHTDLGEWFGDIPQVVKPCQDQFHRINQLLAKQCSPYLLGLHFSAADILYVNCLDWARMQKWHLNDDGKPHDEWPSELLDPYLEACHERPAYLRAHQLRRESIRSMKQRGAEQQSKL